MRLIDAYKMKPREICPSPSNPYEDDDTAYETLVDWIDEQPTVDAKPVVHAHWEVAIGYDPRKPFLCSECLKMNFQMDEYCPHCGAKMDEEEED